MIVKKTKYVVIWGDGCLEEAEYYVYPSNRFGWRKCYLHLYCRLYAGRTDFFNEVMKEYIAKVNKNGINKIQRVK